MFQGMNFAPAQLPGELEALRTEVRHFWTPKQTGILIRISTRAPRPSFQNALLPKDGLA